MRNYWLRRARLKSVRFYLVELWNKGDDLDPHLGDYVARYLGISEADAEELILRARIAWERRR